MADIFDDVIQLLVLSAQVINVHAPYVINVARGRLELLVEELTARDPDPVVGRFNRISPAAPAAPSVITGPAAEFCRSAPAAWPLATRR